MPELPDAELPDINPADLRMILSARQGRVVSTLTPPIRQSYYSLADRDCC